MVAARLFERPREEDAAGLGDYEFEVLPRAGETIELQWKNSTERYDVTRVEHVFVNHAQPGNIAIIVKKPRKTGGMKMVPITGV